MTGYSECGKTESGTFLNLAKTDPLAERRSMIETYWLIIIGLGAVGFIWQFLRQGTLSS